MPTENLDKFYKEFDKQLKKTKEAAEKLSLAKTEDKNEALEILADELLKSSQSIIAANKKDLAAATKIKLPKAKYQRLVLDKKGLEKMASDIREIAKLQDPIGSAKTIKRPNGLVIEKRHIPLGVIAIIYESRPNVTTDVVALCIKSGNATILRGGEEAIHTNNALYQVVKKALKKSKLPVDVVYSIPRTEREIIEYFLKKDQDIDLIVPRGGEGLIKFVLKHTTIPIIRHDRGLTQMYVDATADIKKSIPICLTAKTSKPSACNAVENIYIHQDIVPEFLPKLAIAFNKAKVEMRGCDKTQKIIKCVPATIEDLDTEYLDLIVTIKIVSNVSEGIRLVKKYSSGLSDAILTEDYTNARRFTNEVDSAAVYVNASTRFTDGNEFGKGAEMGIGTQKLHARGPVGPKELTTVKYVVTGDGQYRE